jgi:hypothetical protein
LHGIRTRRTLASIARADNYENNRRQQPVFT